LEKGKRGGSFEAEMKALSALTSPKT